MTTGTADTPDPATRPTPRVVRPHRTRLIRRCLAVAGIAAMAGGCAMPDGKMVMDEKKAPAGGWTVLTDGASGLDNFNRVGSANWSLSDGALQATTGSAPAAFLVSKKSYRDFSLRVEFWASNDANSGVFFRCQDPGTITDENCYEANIFDQRPDPSYGTGAIVKVAKIGDPMPRAGGRWNTYEITAKGPRLQLVLNGQKTVDVEDSRLASGPIALQWGKGTIRFRKVEIKPL